MFVDTTPSAENRVVTPRRRRERPSGVRDADKGLDCQEHSTDKEKADIVIVYRRGQDCSSAVQDHEEQAGEHTDG
jgi:hypothetical protein